MSDNLLVDTCKKNKNFGYTHCPKCMKQDDTYRYKDYKIELVDGKYDHCTVEPP